MKKKSRFLQTPVEPFIVEGGLAADEILSRMERTGVRIDPHLLKTQSHELALRIQELEEQAYATAGRRFNLGSPKQIGEIFFQELRLPVVGKTPTGAPRGLCRSATGPASLPGRRAWWRAAGRRSRRGHS